MKSAAFRGRRSRMKNKEYHLQPRYVMMENTGSRKCYIHPQNEATHWELNEQDKSYKRPVCAGCAQRSKEHYPISSKYMTESDYE